ncbi:AAA family ATPase [Hippea jasoniae]|uniref:AAA family ATPase n=1 Tax=Hippea jasoniae TaxID=944479 RepID=UPI00055280C0|nr:AAA family ATPase [Hippea jasoniae]
MLIKNIFLVNFKNFDFFKANFNRVNVITGPNGAGKTNLLDGIFTALNGHPFRKVIKNIPKDKSKDTIASATIDNSNVIIKISNNQKTIKLNSKTTTSIELKKLFPTIEYSINSFINFKNKDYIFSLLDRGVFAFDKTIIEKIMEYKKLLKIKRNALKQQQFDVVDTINGRFLELVESISNLREKLIKDIKEAVCECFGSFYNKKLDVFYSISKIDEKILQIEKKKGRILSSLKKDRLILYLNGLDLFEFSSVGEKKIALLCIVLSIAKMYNSKGVHPVLLIDDLEGDLDFQTQGRVFSSILKLPNQLFITTLGAYRGFNTIQL